MKTKLSKDKIIAAAIDEFSKKGYNGFVVNELCKQGGISKGVLYHNFSGKADLYLLCARESFKKAMDIIKGEESTVPTLEQYMERRHQFYKAYPKHSRIFFEVMVATPQDIKVELEPYKQMFEELNEQVCLNLLSTSNLKEGIQQEEALTYLRFIQDLFRSYYFNYTEKEDMDIVAVSYEKKLQTVLHWMIFGILEKM